MTNESFVPLLWVLVGAGLLDKGLIERGGLYLENAYKCRTRRLPGELLVESGLIPNTPEAKTRARDLTLEWLKGPDAQTMGLHLHFGPESGVMQNLALAKTPTKAVEAAIVAERQHNFASLRAAIADFGRAAERSTKTLTALATPPRGTRVA